MRTVAKMTVTIRDPRKVDPPGDYKFVVSFKFGATEFHASAKDVQTGEEAQTTVVFIAD